MLWALLHVRQSLAFVRALCNYPKMKNMKKITDKFTKCCLQNRGFVVK